MSGHRRAILLSNVHGLVQGHMTTDDLRNLNPDLDLDRVVFPGHQQNVALVTEISLFRGRDLDHLVL